MYNELLSQEVKISQAQALVTTDIKPYSITETSIRNNSITGIKIADATISGSKIINGTITGTQIANTTISGSKIINSTITGSKISSGTITADKLSVASLSAISADLGTITAGTISSITLNSSTITLDKSSGIGATATGRLRWGSDVNKIWVDNDNLMGLRANGGYFYFYGGTLPVAVISNAGQARFYYGIRSDGNINGYADARITGYLKVGSSSSDYLQVDGYSTLRGILYMNDYPVKDVDYITFDNTYPVENNSLQMYNGELYFKYGGTIYRLNKTAI